jgi:hypothetical protein
MDGCDRLKKRSKKAIRKIITAANMGLWQVGADESY